MKECIPLFANTGATPVFILGDQPAPDGPGGAVLRVASDSELRPVCHQGLCEPWWRNQNLVETRNQLERIKLEFEARDEMAATWKVWTYLASSLSAFTALLVGLFVLRVYPIVGALLVIGGMALQLYAVAGLCGAAESKNESREGSNCRESRR
jgi:hypothetical protein